MIEEVRRTGMYASHSHPTLSQWESEIHVGASRLTRSLSPVLTR